MDDDDWEFGRARSIYRKSSYIDDDEEGTSLEETCYGKFEKAAECENWSVMIHHQRNWKKKKNSSLSCDCFLWNQVTLQTIQLPSDLRHDHRTIIFKAVLSSPPSQPHSLLVLLARNCPWFLFCRVGDTKFTSVRYYEEEEEQFNDLGQAFVDLIPFDSKLVGLKGNGRLCIIQVGPHLLQVVFSGVSLPNSDANWLRNQQLVHSRRGDLLVVRRRSLFSFEIFKVDLVGSRITQVLDLGDQVIFLNQNYSVSVSATELGIRGNCVYFVGGGDHDTLYVFHIGDNTLSISKNQPEVSTLWFSRGGLLPNLRFAGNSSETEDVTMKEESDLEESKQEIFEEDGSAQGDEFVMFKLPMDLKLFTIRCLPKISDYMNFRAVCGGWKSLVPPIRWRPDPTFSTNNVYPWFMFSPEEKGVYNFYDPIHDSTYYMKNKELCQCEIRFSTNGWLLLSQGLRSMFLYEPFTKTKIRLPDLHRDYCFDGVSFEISQTCSEWVVFGICYMSALHVCAFFVKSGDENWTEELFESTRHFLPSYSNPVFFGQGFHCLGQDGSLGIFQISERGNFWDITGKCQSSSFFSTTFRSFLVPAGETLFSVFLTHLGKSIHVFKLNIYTMDWVEMNNLENLILFVSQTSTVAISSKEESMDSTIFFPVFNSSKKNVFYTFKTRRYGTFSRDYSSEDLYETKEILRGTWIKPFGNFVT